MTRTRHTSKSIAVLGLLVCFASVSYAQVPVDRGAIDMMPGLEPQVRNKCIRALQQTRREGKKGAGKLLGRLRAAGLTDAQLDRLRRMPRGVMRQSRYNHGIVLEAPELSEAQRLTLAHLVAAADGAQITLATQRVRMAQALKGVEALVRNQALSRIDQHVREIDRRFWRVAYYALTADQMRAVRRLLAPRASYIPQLREQMLALPGLTPSQGSRVAAAFAEYEAEQAADQALVRRLQAERRKKDQPGPKVQEINRELGAGYRRLGALREGFRKRLQEVLSQDQRDALNSAPPLLNLGERGRPPFDIVRGMALTKERMDALRRLQKTTNTARQVIQKDARDAYRESGLGGAMMGSDSPQSMTMDVMRRGTLGRLYELYRESGQTLVTKVMPLSKVSAWVVWAPG